mmetsp:Transcript_42983/g.93586  ORF Transcript_42983/g.93586 Transcript_42983/m.93586 type:complete len:252 (+) Transcript_42983:79-834(+)
MHPGHVRTEGLRHLVILVACISPPLAAQTFDYGRAVRGNLGPPELPPGQWRRFLAPPEQRGPMYPGLPPMNELPRYRVQEPSRASVSLMVEPDSSLADEVARSSQWAAALAEEAAALSQEMRKVSADLRRPVPRPEWPMPSEDQRQPPSFAQVPLSTDYTQFSQPEPQATAAMLADVGQSIRGRRYATDVKLYSDQAPDATNSTEDTDRGKRMMDMYNNLDTKEQVSLWVVVSVTVVFSVLCVARALQGHR